MSENQEAKSRIDIFLWANRVQAEKKDIDVEFFLFNKNYTPFSVSFSKDVESQIRPLFLYDLINQVELGSQMGLSVQEFELAEAEENVLLTTKLSNVGRAETLINTIKTTREEIAIFSEADHEFKRMKGVIAMFTPKDEGLEPFFVVKQINQGQVLGGVTAWEFKEGRFQSYEADFGVKMPADNQVLIIADDIFVFNQTKFERIFSYDYKKQLIADKKVEEIEKNFKLVFPEGLNMQALVREKKNVINKLQKIDPELMKQDQLLDYSDEMQLDLMTSDDGSIIIMDGHDLDTFVNLLNEDYIVSNVTGKRYVIKSKKLLNEPEGEPPRS